MSDLEDWKFSTKQLQVFSYENQYKPIQTILEGAVRSGKTHLAMYLFFRMLMRHRDEGKRFILTGYTIGSLKKNVLAPLDDEFSPPLPPIHLNQTNEFKYLGNVICCFGADHSGAYKTMRGMTSHGWYANEVTLQHPNTIDEAFKRCSGKDARIIWDTNPDHPEHYIKTNYIDKSGDRMSDGRVRIKAWHFKLEDNIHLTEEYKENIKLATPSGVYYNRGILGLWVAAEGTIFKDWDIDKHICEPFKIPEEWPKIFGIDWGFNNPCAMLWAALSPDDILYVYDEYYESEKLIKHIAYHAHKKSGTLINEKVIPDNFTKKDCVPLNRKIKRQIADHDSQDIAEIRQYRISPIKARKKNVMIGIKQVAQRMVTRKNGKPGLIVLRGKAPQLIREIPKYVLNEKESPSKDRPEEPIKKDDHAIDALRYMVMELDYPSMPIISVKKRIA